MHKLTRIILTLAILAPLAAPLPYPAPVAAQDGESVTVDFDQSLPLAFSHGVASLDSGWIDDTDPLDQFVEPAPEILTPIAGSSATIITDLGGGRYRYEAQSCASGWGPLSIKANSAGQWSFDWLLPTGSNNNNYDGTSSANIYRVYLNGVLLSDNYGWRDWSTSFDYPLLPVSPGNEIQVIFGNYASGVIQCDPIEGILYSLGAVVRVDFDFSTAVNVSGLSFAHRNGGNDSPYAIAINGGSADDYIFNSGVDWSTRNHVLDYSDITSLSVTWSAESIDIDDIVLNYEPIPEPDNDYTYPVGPNDIIDYGQADFGDRAAVYANWFMQPHNPANYAAGYEDPIPDIPFDDSNYAQLTALADDPGDPIHSPAYGEIVSITPLSAADCITVTSDTGAETLGDLLIALGIGFLSGGAAQGGLLLDDIQAYLAGATAGDFCVTDEQYIGGAVYSQDKILPVGDIVHIWDYVAGTNLYYVVADADQYLAAGQKISPGCVLGLALPVFVDYGAGLPEPAGLGAAYIWATSEIDTEFDVRSRYVYWPKSDDPCNSPEFAAGECINANDLFEPGPPFGWTVTPLPVDLYSDLGALIMGPSTTASQVLSVGAADLAVYVSGFVDTPNTTGDSTLTVTLGDTDHTFTFPAGGALVQDSSALAAHSDSDYGAGILDLSVAQAAGQDGTIVLKRVCVSSQIPDFEPLPECVIDNAGFDDQSAWVLSGGAPPGPSIGNGALTLIPGAQADQTIYLPADGYTIDVRYRPEPLLMPPVGGYTADLGWYVYDSGMAAIDNGNWTEVNGGEWVDVSDHFTVAAGQEVTISLSTAASGSSSLQIDLVCLTPDYLPAGGEDTPPGAVSCNSCPRTYIGDLIHDVPEGIHWLACELNRTYYCDARKIMTDTRAGVNNTVRGIGMLGRWFYATFSKQAIATKSLAYFIGGYLNNTARMIQDAYYYAGGASTYIFEDQPTSLFDVLALLISGLRDVLITALNDLTRIVSYIVPVAGMLRDVALAALALAQGVIDAIAAQVANLVTIFAAIIDATNVDPATIEGAPDCSGSLVDGSAHWICWGFYILDNTVFAGAAGYMLPILIAAASLNLLIWAFEQLKDAIADAA